MRNITKNKTIKMLFILIILTFLINFISAATIKTTDVDGNLKLDFAPEESVFIRGSGFSPNSLVLIEVLRPDSALNIGLTFSDNNGKIFYIYLLDGIVGTYYTRADDGTNIAETSFTDAAIWTTRTDCGNSTQNVNFYNVNETVFINGNGFSVGSYGWEIKGKPGGASCDPNIVVASGTQNINSSGSFCIGAYNISSGDCGEYQVKFGVKGDNYRITGNACTRNSTCGIKNSNLICIGNNVFNETIAPACINGSCNITNTTTFVNSCGSSTSSLLCIGNNLVNLTVIPTCDNGACFNVTNISLIQECEICEEEECINCVDNDGDGFNVTGGEFCGPIDCNDNNSNINPDANEVCDGVDNDCDDLIDEGFDKDDDGVADCFDQCPKSKSNEPVDQYGCDIFQFCKSKSCGYDCFYADWNDNEPNTKYPNDCTAVVVLRNGKEQQPVCVPTEFSDMCAG